MVAVELRLCGREGDVAIFEPVSQDLRSLDLMAMVEARGLEAVLNNIHVWSHEQSDALVMLNQEHPCAGVTSNQMLTTRNDFTHQAALKLLWALQPFSGDALDFDNHQMVVRAGSV